MNIATLPAILRTLLVTDGTVTKTLEAYFWEPVLVSDVQQDEITNNSSIDFNGSKAGEALLDRRIRLVGQSSNTTYAYAHSFIRLDILPAEFRSDLKSGRIGIGEILRETGLETYRELVDLGECVNQASGNESNMDNLNETCPTNEHVIYRTYQIMINHNPAIQVTEQFPVSTYQK